MANVIVGVIVFAGIGLAAWKTVKDRMAGKSSCGGDCNSCHRACHFNK